MYRDLADYWNIYFTGNNSHQSFVIPFVLFTILFILLYADSFAQWVNNPASNTELVLDTSDPINISTVRDLRGGSFIFWQDNKLGFQNEVYFAHVDSYGKNNLIEEGKKVTDLFGPEEDPVCCELLQNSSIVIWNDYTGSRTGDLYAQKVFSDGSLSWSEDGLKLTNSGDEISGYSVCADKSGDVFIAYISKAAEINEVYKVEIQKLNAEGKSTLNPAGLLVYNSRERKSMTSVIPDNKGGVFIFWVQDQNSKSLILGQHIDSDGNEMWGKKPVDVSGSTHNVITYVAKQLENNFIYLAWEAQKKSKSIYHQLINEKGRILWGKDAKQVTSLKGNQTNPQIFNSDSTLILSWTNEQGSTGDIYIQNYNMSAKPLWNKQGIPVIKYRGDQFGQHIVSDGKGGAIVAWIDRRSESSIADIYAQRINKDGKVLWDSLGVAVAVNHNTPKSYLSLISDEEGGAVVIFKNKRNNKNKIYGQKLFSNGAYVSHISGFTTKLQNDTIKILWDSDNEPVQAKYNVERAVQTQGGDINWGIIGTVNSAFRNNTFHYEFSDVPDITGTLYYRIAQIDAQGNVQKSDVSRINYFGAYAAIVVAQNMPNPFSDSTVISFYLPDPSSVKIEFFDDHVEKISEIAKYFPAGENKFTFFTKGLKPGIYFYRLKVDDFVDVKKMIITN